MSLVALLMSAALGAADAPFTVAPDLLLTQDPAPADEGHLEGFQWGGNLTAGLVILAGNSRSTQASLDTEVIGEDEMDRITLKAGWRSARQRDPDTKVESTTARSLYGSGKYDRFFAEHWFGYALAQARKDGVADLDLFWSVGVGTGVQWIREEDEHLSTEVGIGYTEEDYGDDNADAEYLSARAALHYDVKLSETSEFFHDSEWVPSLKDFDEDQLIVSTTGVRAQIRSNLSGEARVVWLWDSSPAAGRERQDVVYIFGLTWTF